MILRIQLLRDGGTPIIDNQFQLNYGWVMSELWIRSTIYQKDAAKRC